MRSEFYYPSAGVGMIHACCWMPVSEVKAVVQIVHGIAEYAARYDEFAEFLAKRGVCVVASDHMGHGGSIDRGGTQGYFDGGWDAACRDVKRLMDDTAARFPGVPYYLFGHSMGSFIARTVLYRWPDHGISGAVICGTGWMADAVVTAGHTLAKLICRTADERKPSPMLQGVAFGGYNKRVEHKRTEYDWLSRDKAVVDAYIADPMCGFTASAGLMRDMMGGIRDIQKPEHLARMDRELPVLFIAGSDDPVGDYGKGVETAAEQFRQAGMKHVSVKLYPLCRHEILNELNRLEVFGDVANWLNV